MRVFFVCLGFNTKDMIEGAFRNFQETVVPAQHNVKWFFDVGYPGNDPQSLKELCSKYGWIYSAFPNEGVLPNHNKVIHEYLNMVNGDFYVTFDPDVRMDKPGWAGAMIEALDSDPKAMFCSSALNFHADEWMQKPPYNRKVTQLASGLRISRYDCLIAWASGMWRADFLITRPRDFGARGKYYGWNEHADYERLLKHGYSWLSVADYVDNHLGAPDPKYVEWKQLYAAGRVQEKFEDWVKNGSR